jgi:hypothetical protein
MNMLRNLLAISFLILGGGLMFGKPDEWKWPDVCGPYVVEAVGFCSDFRPWTYIVCFVLAVALFMTRKIY